MKKPKVDMSGVEAANKAIAEAQAAATNLQQNFKADLKSDALTEVEVGGTGMSDLEGPLKQSKRRRAGPLSSQLGVNV